MTQTEQVKLPELANSVKVVGTLKEVNLEIKPNKKDPSVKQIMGDIVVTVVDGQRINEHRVNLFAKETGKLFKGYKTIKDTYKSSDLVGSENADRVSVVGSISGNDYMNSEGELISTNRIRGLFVNRVEQKDIAKDPSLATDSAVAQVELVVTGFTEVLGQDDVPTGELYIKGFTVGYNNSIVELKKMVIGEDLAEAVRSMYPENSTGKLNFKMNNYVEVVERKKENFDVPGFGIQVDIGGTFDRYVNELRLIGGVPPYYDEREYTEENIKLAKQTRALHLEEIKNAVPATPPAKQADPNTFGQDPFSTTSATIDISDDDLPF